MSHETRLQYARYVKVAVLTLGDSHESAMSYLGLTPEDYDDILDLAEALRAEP